MEPRSTLPSTLTEFASARLRKWSAYDLVMRLPMLTWSVVLALELVMELAEYRRAADLTLPAAIYVLNIAMRLSTIGYLVTLAATVIVRTPPVEKAPGAEPRVSALLGSFLITAVVLFLAATFHPPRPAYRHCSCSSETQLRLLCLSSFAPRSASWPRRGS